MSIQFKIKKLCIFLVILIFQSEILFTVSAKVWVVDNKNTESADLMEYGMKLRPFKSIFCAAQLAGPEDTGLVLFATTFFLKIDILVIKKEVFMPGPGAYWFGKEEMDAVMEVMQGGC